MKGKDGNPSEGIPDSDRHTEEKNWIKAIRNGDKGIFKKMFETYYNPLLRFAFRYVKSEPVAEGLVQNVFLWIWENKEEWDVEGNLKTYLFRAIKYKAMDNWRHEMTRKKYMEQFSELQEKHVEPKLPCGPEENEFLQATQEAIEDLPEKARMVYKLSRLEGLTYHEIAEVLDISIKTVETHMSRALDYLRKRLSRYLPLLFVFGLVS